MEDKQCKEHKEQINTLFKKVDTLQKDYHGMNIQLTNWLDTFWGIIPIVIYKA